MTFKDSENTRVIRSDILACTKVQNIDLEPASPPA